LTPALEAELDRLRDSRVDRTMGFISNALSYSKQFRSNKKRHTNIVRLIKGGFVRVVQIHGSPPAGSIASQDAPYSDSYYELEPV
jgi:hypothetical protein